MCSFHIPHGGSRVNLRNLHRWNMAFKYAYHILRQTVGNAIQYSVLYLRYSNSPAQYLPSPSACYGIGTAAPSNTDRQCKQHGYQSRESLMKQHDPWYSIQKRVKRSITAKAHRSRSHPNGMPATYRINEKLITKSITIYMKSPRTANSPCRE